MHGVSHLATAGTCEGLALVWTPPRGKGEPSSGRSMCRVDNTQARSGQTGASPSHTAWHHPRAGCPLGARVSSFLKQAVDHNDCCYPPLPRRSVPSHMRPGG